MSGLLYVTADRIGTATGGGLVTHHELRALRSLGEVNVYSRDEMVDAVEAADDPWCWDNWLRTQSGIRGKRLAHFYAGTFSDTVGALRRDGAKVTYTAAAHDVAVSRAAHEELGLKFDLPHLVVPELWQRYVRGYLEADVLVVPSSRSAAVMRGFGAVNRIEVVPHGCELPPHVPDFPSKFALGYMGAVSPDKGVVDLLRAWKRLDYADATLVLAGSESRSPFLDQMIRAFGGGNIRQLGWVNELGDYYRQVTAVVQPSRTEGFGLEVLEGMAHGRPVICSDGAGAADLVPEGRRFRAGDVDGLCRLIEQFREQGSPRLAEMGRLERGSAKGYTWSKIRDRYVRVWESLQ